MNQQVKVNTAYGKEVRYAYNGEGLRVYKSVGDKVTRYLYEGLNVIYETDGSGNKIARIVKGINLISRNVNGSDLYYLYNGHKDVVALTNKEGNIVATYYYDTFGVLTESTGTVDNPIRYSGYQYDEETGLYYLNARMYDATTGRFLQEDTYTGDIKDPLSLNLYTYCQNNPLIYEDPTGHIPIFLLFGAAVIGGALINSGVKAISDLVKTGSFGSVKSYVGSAVSGGISGGAAFLTGGSSFLIRAAGNGLAGFAGSCVEQKISTGKVDCGEAFFSGIFSSVASGRVKDIKKAAGFVGSSAKNAASKIANSNIGKKVEPIIKSIASKLKTPSISSAAAKTKEIASKSIKTIKDTGKIVAEKVSNAITKASNTIENGLKKAKSTIKNTANNVVSKVSKVSSVVESKISAIKNAAENFSKNMQRAFGPQYQLSLAEGYFDDALDIAEDIALNEQKGILSTIKKAVSKGKGSYQGAGNPKKPVYKYWNNSVEFNGNKVYQRNDLFDPNAISSWKEKGKKVIGTNVERMQSERAPIGYDGKPINLHHMTQTQSGAIAEVSQSFHQANKGIIHINPNTVPSGINRNMFNQWKEGYWMNRANDFID